MMEEIRGRQQIRKQLDAPLEKLMGPSKYEEDLTWTLNELTAVLHENQRLRDELKTVSRACRVADFNSVAIYAENAANA